MKNEKRFNQSGTTMVQKRMFATGELAQFHIEALDMIMN